jgi:hypothetical protein
MVDKDGNRSPASIVMDEAIELGIEERSPYPERASFIDADLPHTEESMRRAAEGGYHVVLVSADHSTKVISVEEILVKRSQGGDFVTRSKPAAG